MKKSLLMPMRLQLFASENGSDEGSKQEGTSTNQGSSQLTDPKPGDDDGKEVEGKTFTRDDVAKMVAAETAKALAKAQQEWETNKNEAEEFAKMNEQEKNAKLQEKIAELERQQTLTEMAKTATSMLADKGIQANEGILSFVVKESAEATSERVKTFSELIDFERELIKTDFEKRLGGKVPLEGSISTTLSIGEQAAKEVNEAKKNKTDIKDPWNY